MNRGMIFLLGVIFTISNMTRGRAVAEEPGAIVLRGLSIYGGANEQGFPIVFRDSIDSDGKPVRYTNRLTIQFDMQADNPPELKIRFFHCTRDWTPDNNVFVQDEHHNASFSLDFQTAPLSVKEYHYRYVNHFPDDNDAVRFDFSGNWVFVIMDEEETQVYARGRFFVVDLISPTVVRVLNDFITENSSPLNQAHKVVARVVLPNEVDGFFYTTCDIYQNRRWQDPYRVDANDRDTYTQVEGYGSAERTFTISDILPGNEYRTLDITNVNRYPDADLVRPVEGADQPRYFWRTGPDMNGTAIRNPYSGIHGDYLPVLFRLDLTVTDFNAATRGGRGVFLAGAFNCWNPRSDDRLQFDADEGSLTVTKLLRRGVYDYQYVTGIWDPSTEAVASQNWIELEGNDWRTTNEYSVFVYYNDQRYGGFDRIVGYGKGTSSGSIEPSK